MLLACSGAADGHSHRVELNAHDGGHHHGESGALVASGCRHADAPR